MKIPDGWVMIPKIINHGTGLEVESRELVKCENCDSADIGDCAIYCRHHQTIVWKDDWCSYGQCEEGKEHE